ncbi:glycosyltransferase family 2 protein [Blastomonas aquatica]|uniref:glycosyltransferase family 2 protein n=1 Tax=Blastomonas aquatica TaxID=1510276 RepID=UPI001663B1E6
MRKQRQTWRALTSVRQFPRLSSKQRHDLDAPLVVTLTSYPPRFAHLAKTIRSLLDQTVAADQTILWVAHQDLASLPADVRKLEAHGLTIKGCDDLQSYKKLIPALEEDPDRYFVTADDDVYYPETWLQALVDGARAHGGEVIAGRVHEAQIDALGKFVPYQDWQLASDRFVAGTSDTRLFPTGVGGVLYPPGAFSPQVMDRSLFLELAPRGDDIWFFWMARLAGTNQRRANLWFDIIEWPRTQKVALFSENLLGNGNDRQLRAMFAHFGPVP